MRGVDVFKHENGGTGASAEFTVWGGRYQVMVASATFGGGNVVLQQLGNDGVSGVWLPVHTALTAVGVTVVEIPAGQYRLFSVTATVIYATVARIAGE